MEFLAKGATSHLSWVLGEISRVAEPLEEDKLLLLDCRKEGIQRPAQILWPGTKVCLAWDLGQRREDRQFKDGSGHRWVWAKRQCTI